MKNKKELDPQTKIYLLVAPGSKSLQNTIGFKALGSGEQFTFAFTSPEKIKNFIKYQGKKGFLGSIRNEVRTYWMTLEEYFANPNNNELYIDPPDNFQADLGLPNLN